MTAREADARPGPADPADLAAVSACLDRAVGALRQAQNPAGWWKGELRTNVTMDAEDLLMRHVLGADDPGITEAAAHWIRSQQQADGSWSTFPGGPGDLSTTVEAYVALRLAGDPPDAEAMSRAAGFVRSAGGLEGTRVFTRIWLALIGVWSWDDIPALPPELIWLPRWFPLNVYDWACWARQTVVPLTVVSALRVRRPVGFGLEELRSRPPTAPSGAWAGARSGARPAATARRDPAGATALDRAVRWGDRLLRRYHRHPVGPLRRAALRRAAGWVIERQEADGSWGGIQPPWVYSILALHGLGYPLDHPVLKKALDGLETFVVRDGTAGAPMRRLEACQSPVWDTALAVTALRDAGESPDAPGVRAACTWLLGEEIRRPGDWAVRRPGVPAAGWAFEFANDGYPDIDDSAEVVLALGGIDRAGAACRRAVDWILQMQCRDSGWAAFDVDNTSPWPARLPFCDFGAVTDPPSADVTAHVVEMLARPDVAPVAGGGTGGGAAQRSRALDRGVAWLLAAQEKDGSWFGRWGANHVYGVGAVVPALIGAGIRPGHPAIMRAVEWIVRHQNPDGGWGEDLRSYRDPAWRGRGTSTPSQTAWALLALLAAGHGAAASGHGGSGLTRIPAEASRAVDTGVAWLLARQRPDGWWDEEQHTGTGFPGDFYIHYDLYRMVFPISALGRYRRVLQEQEGT
jgi:squalene-hopene/tetraprenyl-beta-curcumene cyclase